MTATRIRAARVATWAIRAALAAVAAAMLAVLLAGCTLTTAPGGAPTHSPTGADEPPAADDIASITYRLTQALPGFDDGTFVSTDRQRITDLADLLDELDIEGEFPPPGTQTDTPCPPGTGTGHITYTRTTGAEVTLSLGGCSPETEAARDALWSLARGWHEQDAA